MKPKRTNPLVALLMMLAFFSPTVLTTGCDTPFSNHQRQIDDLEEDVDRIDMELDELRDEIARVDGEIDRIDTTIDDYVAQFVGEVERLDDLIKANADTIDKNYKELEGQIEDALDTALTKIGELETAINKRVDSLEAEVFAEISDLSSSINTLFGIAAAQQVQISANAFQAFWRIPNVVIPNAISGLRDELLPQIQDNAADIAANTAAITALTTRTDSLETAVGNLESDLGTLEGRVDDLDIDDIEDLRDALKGLGDDIDDLRADMNEAIDDLRDELIEYIDDEIKDVNDDIEDLEGRVSDNEDAIVDILNDISDLRTDLTALEEALGDLDDLDEGIIAELEALEQKIDALETQLIEYIDDEVKDITERIEALESAVGIDEDELDDLLEDYNNLAEAIEHILGVLEGNGNGGNPFTNLQDQIDDLEERIEALEASIGVPTVTYDANGATMGSVPVDDTEYEIWDEVIVLDNVGNLAGPIIRDGIMQRFIGWNTNPNATDVLLNPGETFDITGNTTLYAIYTTGDDVLRKVGPAGGWVFFDSGTTESWGRYLEAWNEDEPGTYKLKTSRTYTPGTTMNIGGGYENTYVGMSDISIHPAAEAVVNATHGGFNDWFLPSRHELNELYRVLHYTGYYGSEVQESVADFSDEFYWSSSFGGPDTGFSWAINFKYTESLDPDNHFYDNDNDGLRVRAVRAF